MPLGSYICRKKLDESRGQKSICECPMCRQKRSEDERLFHGERAGESLRGQSKDDLSKVMGEGDTSL